MHPCARAVAIIGGEKLRDRVSKGIEGMAGWYLVQCKPRQDERAQCNLRNQGFVCYRPVRRVQKVRQRRRVSVVESLFPGYLFIRLDRLQDNWSSIRSTRGVSHIVSFAKEPARVPAALINQLKTSESDCIEHAAFRAGDHVRIIEGAFSELEAIYLREDGSERAILLLNLLHRQQELKVPLGSFKPLESRTVQVL